MNETEEALIRGMRENPTCLMQMAALADYWQEQGDPRHEPMTWLVQNGRVGGRRGFLYLGAPLQHTLPRRWIHALVDAACDPATYGAGNYDPRLHDQVDERFIACEVYLAADEATRRAYLQD